MPISRSISSNRKKVSDKSFRHAPANILPSVFLFMTSRFSALQFFNLVLFLTHKYNTHMRQIRYLVTVSKGISSGTAIFSKKRNCFI
jgi:hypothetical protein